jgi:hypothetical protein
LVSRGSPRIIPWLSCSLIGELVGGPVCADPVRVSLRPLA